MARQQNERRENNPILGFCSLDQSSPSPATTIRTGYQYQDRCQAPPFPVPEPFRGNARTLDGSNSAPINFDAQWSELMAMVRDIQQQMRDFHAEFQRSSSEWSQALSTAPAISAVLETPVVSPSSPQLSNAPPPTENDQSLAKVSGHVSKTYTQLLSDGKRLPTNGSALAALQQFERLRDARTGLLTNVHLEKIAYSFCHRNLENINDTLRFAIGDLLKETGESTLALDHDAFTVLKSEDILAKASFGIHRDLTTVQEALRKEEVTFLYKDNGGEDDFDERSFPAAARKYSMLVLQSLEFVPTLVVFLQALLMGLSAEIEPGLVVWEVIEVLFTAVYLLEALFKIHLFGLRGYFCGPQRLWHWLDFFCLIISFIDLIGSFVMKVHDGSLSLLVLFRLMRLFKLARLLKMLRLPMFKELNLMLMGLVSGGRVLMWAVVILCTIIYLFALVMNKLADSHREFQSMTASMATLFRCFTEGCATYEGAPLTEKLRETYGMAIYIFYGLAYIFVTVGVFNLIMALFIDNVSQTQHERKQQHLSESYQAAETDLKEIITKLVVQSKASGVPTEVENDIKSLGNAFSSRDMRVRAQFQCLSDATIHILGQQFSVWLEDSSFLRVLENAEIDVHNKASLFEVLDADLSGSVTVLELLNGLLKLRGPVTKADIIAIRLKVRQLITTVVHGE